MTIRTRPPERIVILGAGQHGRETLDILEALNDRERGYDFVGFLDDGPGNSELLDRRGAQVVGRFSDLGALRVRYVIGIGNPALRHEVAEAADAIGIAAASLVHPSATVGADVRWAPGLVVSAGAHITTNVHLGRHVHLNVAATIAHDCRIGSYTSLSPGVHLSGCVVVGDEVLLGTGAVVNPGCRIGTRAVVGSGAVVIEDVAPDAVVAGVPARVIEGRKAIAP